MKRWPSFLLHWLLAALLFALSLQPPFVAATPPAISGIHPEAYPLGQPDVARFFTGQQFDPDLGLYYLRARYHNPDSGRFWTADAFEGFASDPGSLHRYTYCHNNPVNCVDPSGNQSLPETSMVFGIGVNTRFALGALAGFYTGGAYGGINAYMHGGNLAQVSDGFLLGGLSGALFGGLLGPLPNAFWGSALGNYFMATMSITSLSSAALNYTEGQNLMAGIDVVFAVAPWALSSSVFSSAIERVSMSFTRVSLPKRLEYFFARLKSAPQVNSPTAAIKQINKHLDAVEDAFSGVSKNPSSSPPPDGRMYGPTDSTYLTTHSDGSVTALTKGHRMELGTDGRIRILHRKTGELVLEKKGAGGVE